MIVGAVADRISACLANGATSEIGNAALRDRLSVRRDHSIDKYLKCPTRSSFDLCDLSGFRQFVKFFAYFEIRLAIFA
jgi:hypothetical protein